MRRRLTREELEERAARIRRLVLEMIYVAGSGHPGGSLSAVDLLTYLFCCELRFRPGEGDWRERDRFVLSKGHACPALYAVGAEVGLLPAAELNQLRRFGSPLQGHPDVRSIPWVEASTGSLGQGFSAAIGMALGLRFSRLSSRVYAMLGDGELQEGSIWEGAMFAGHRRLNHFCAIIDYNRMQSDDLNENIVGIEPLRLKWEAFNWRVNEINGHDFDAMAEAFEEARAETDAPTVIVAHTVKGKGVSFMENSPKWHGSLRLRREEVAKALGELGATAREVEKVCGDVAGS